MKPVAASEALFEYLYDVIYSPDNAFLEVETLPDEFHDLGYGLQFFAKCVNETRKMLYAMSRGDLECEMPSRDNVMSAHLKALHAALKHLTWQTQQIAQGDYMQRVSFLGDFDKAFNTMTAQLEEKRKRDLQEKAELQQYIDVILYNAPAPILLFDTENKAVLASESYYKIRKTTHDELKDKTINELLSPVATSDVVEKINALVDVVRAEGLSHVAEHEVDFALSKKPRTYLVHVSPMLQPDGAAMGTMLIFEDISETIRLLRETDKARLEAQAANRAKIVFLEQMSHEMRTPMHTILGMAAIGTSSDDSDSLRQCFENIDNAAQRLLYMINGVLEMSELEADKLELSNRAFHFGNMIGNAVKIIDPQIRMKKQNFSMNIDPNIPTRILSDEKRLLRVLISLLTNAVKFTPEKGKISLRARLVDATDKKCTICFSVMDNGIGISKQLQKRLFLPFEQADKGRSRKYEGIGLGLAWAKRVAGMLGGDIRVDSQPDKGATFTFEIEAAISAQSNDVIEDKMFSGRRIMVADDLEMNRIIIETMLENSGVEIVFANNGIEAVEKFKAAPNDFDMILMDISMPEMDGYEATHEIRFSGVSGGGTVPIVAVSANSSLRSIAESFEAGMNEHLCKPVDIDELLLVMDKYLSDRI
jgi:PAS domain S-box-containing protein